MVRCKFDGKVVCDTNGDYDWCSSCVQLAALHQSYKTSTLKWPNFYPTVPMGNVTIKNQEPYSHSLGATGRWSITDYKTDVRVGMMVDYLKNDKDEDCCASNNDCRTCRHLDKCYKETKKDNEKKRHDNQIKKVKASPCVGCRQENGYPCVHYKMTNTECIKRKKKEEQEKCVITHSCLDCIAYEKLTGTCLDGCVKSEKISDWGNPDTSEAKKVSNCGICGDKLDNVNTLNVTDWICFICQKKALKSHDQKQLDDRERERYHNDLKKVSKWSVIISAIIGGLWYGLPIVLKGLHKVSHWMVDKISSGLHGVNDATIVIKNFGIPYPMQAIILFAIVLGITGTLGVLINKSEGIYTRDD